MGHRGSMRRLSVLAAIKWLIAPAIAGAQEREGGKPATDRTVPVTRGSRLAIGNDAGEVVIRTWDRDSLRVRATHSDRVSIDVQTSASIVTIRSKSGGPRASVDYDITTPAWMPVKVSGQFLFIGIEGAQNEVSAETVRGDIVIKGGSGIVTAKSIHGEIIVEDAKGRISVSSVNEAIRVTGASGEIVAETTNGDITLSKIQAKLVDVATVNGDVHFEGGFSTDGQYRFVTHNGDITMVIPETAAATFTVRTYNGDFQSNLPTKPVGEIRRGRRASYTLGTGGPEVELESFGGTIRLRRPGTAPPRRSKDEQARHSARSATIGSICAARSAGAAAATVALEISRTAIAARLHGSHGSIRKSMSDKS
jgi:Putative adhesin